MELIIDNIALTPDQPEKMIKSIISEYYSVDSDFTFHILRKSLDARNKKKIVYIYKVVIDVSDITAEQLLANKNISQYSKKEFPDPVYNLKGQKILIVGTGPAGLFCALRLIEAGAYVEIFERGKPIEERIKDIHILENEGILNEQSNVLFGEGGAGTYSDGKLTTRTHKPEIDWFYKKLVEFGASSSILYEAKPHLGSDGIRNIIKNIRKKILDSGSKIYFNEQVIDILIYKNAISGVVTSAGNEYSGSILALAPGHSARDIYELLNKKNIALEKKGFAVGVRIEHSAELINSIQYGNSPYKKILPTAEYRLIFNNKSSKRGIYSFCMCPGGSVINSSSENYRLCTNGMSFSKRNSPFSNSAIVVTVNINDVEKEVLSGIEFQRKIEQAAFSAGGGNFTAPAQTIKYFLNNKINNTLPEVSFKPGIAPSKLNDYLPQWITDEIKTALHDFDKKMKGFISGGIFIGAETRTSSPIRISRDKNYQSISHKGLYPIGEGAGYSGGIVSSAVDGIRAADAIALMK